jgi:hypothetical protein
MIIPTFQAVQFVDQDGYLTSQMQMYNDELNNVLRNALSDNGWTVPQVTQAQLAEINGFTGIDAMPDGTMWMITDNDNMVYELVVRINGALRKVTTTAYP